MRSRLNSSPTYMRVAVVQLACHPAIVAEPLSSREDPLYPPKQQRGSPLPPRGGVPACLTQELRARDQCIRQVYDDQFLAEVQAVLAACRDWGAQLVVFPEHSLPWELLGGVANAAWDMAVIAGAHSVDRAALESGIFSPGETWAQVSLPPGLPGPLGILICLDDSLYHEKTQFERWSV